MKPGMRNEKWEMRATVKTRSSLPPHPSPCLPAVSASLPASYNQVEQSKLEQGCNQ